MLSCIIVIQFWYDSPVISSCALVIVVCWRVANGHETNLSRWVNKSNVSDLVLLYEKLICGKWHNNKSHHVTMLDIVYIWLFIWIMECQIFWDGTSSSHLQSPVSQDARQGRNYWPVATVHMLTCCVWWGRWLNNRGEVSICCCENNQYSAPASGNPSSPSRRCGAGGCTTLASLDSCHRDTRHSVQWVDIADIE